MTITDRYRRLFYYNWVHVIVTTHERSVLRDIRIFFGEGMFTAHAVNDRIAQFVRRTASRKQALEVSFISARYIVIDRNAPRRSYVNLYRVLATNCKIRNTTYSAGIDIPNHAGRRRISRTIPPRAIPAALDPVPSYPRVDRGIAIYDRYGATDEEYNICLTAVIGQDDPLSRLPFTLTRVT